MNNLIIEKDISEKHKLLIINYCNNNFNKTQAWVDTFPDSKPKSAITSFCKLLLVNEGVKRALDKAVAEHLALIDTKSIASREYLIQQSHEIGLKAEKSDKLDTALNAIEKKAKLAGVYQEKQGGDKYSIFVQNTFGNTKASNKFEELPEPPEASEEDIVDV